MRRMLTLLRFEALKLVARRLPLVAFVLVVLVTLMAPQAGRVLNTAGSLMSDQGAPLTAIQHRLGHSSLATTVKVYTHLTDGRAREAADLLDDVLGGA